MNESIIRNHNMRITNEDTFIHNGDFCFKSGANCAKAEDWLSRLNGQKIMIRGNHDNNNSLKTIIDDITVTFANYRIKIVHKPEHANPNLPINIVGHVHNKWHIKTFAQHYKDIMNAMEVVASDRQDWARFLEVNAQYSNSQSILFNCGVDVNDYMPISLDEVLGKIQKWKNTK